MGKANIISKISASGLTIYDSLSDNPELFLTPLQLQLALSTKLTGVSLANLPLRTRSKVVKSSICNALGYPVPERFKRTRPKFPGQDFDVYVQKSNNLQIWNEEVSPSRRYVIIVVDQMDRIFGVHVLGGEELAQFDSTGTLTSKYQARRKGPVINSTLVSPIDTQPVLAMLASPPKGIFKKLLPISQIFERLMPLVGTTIDNPGADQERNRGAILHNAVKMRLRATSSLDSGQFPDIREQLLEVKLQTSPTIDLGLVSPDSTDSLSTDIEIRHCDVRYAIFYGKCSDQSVELQSMVMTTGESFFSHFQRFEGKVQNKKLQLHLPSSYFVQPKGRHN